MKPHPLAPSAAGLLPAHVLPVIVELRSTVRRISVLMTGALDADTTACIEHVRLASALLAQSSAALDFAGLDDVAALTQLIQRALSPVATATSPLSPALVLAINRSLSALLCHFNSYATVAAQALPATRLYPAYRDLAALLGESTVSPAAFLSLQRQAVVAIDMTAYRQQPDGNQRQQFEYALLHYLRAQSRPEHHSAAARMAAVMGDIASRQTDASTQSGWQILVAFAELAASDVSVDIPAAKKIFSCVGRLVRHLGHTEVGKPPSMLVRDALVIIASTKCPTPLAQTIRQMFRLEQQMRLDFDVDYYGIAEPAALAELCTALDGSRRALDAVADDLDTPALLALQLQTLATAAAAIPAFDAVPAALQRVAAKLNRENLSQHHALQLAICLLYMEQFVTEPDELVGVLAWVPTLLDDLLTSLDDMAHRLSTNEDATQETAPNDLPLQAPAPPSTHPTPCAILPGASWVQWRSAVVALKATLIQTLASVESRLEDEIAAAGGGLAEAGSTLNRWLCQIFSALLVLGERDAAACAQQLRDMLAKRVLHEDASDAASCAQSAAAIASRFVQLASLVDAITCAPPCAVRPGRQAGSDTSPTRPYASTSPPPPAPDVPLLTTDPGDSAPQNPPLLVIYLDEAQQLTAQLDWLLSCWLDAPQNPLPMLAVHAAHSLAGSSATVGAQSLHELAAALEEILQIFVESGAPPPDMLRPLLPEIVRGLQTMLDQLAGHATPQHDGALLSKLAAIKLAIQPSLSRAYDSDTVAVPVAPAALPDKYVPASMPTADPSALPASRPDSPATQDAGQHGGQPARQHEVQAALSLSAAQQDAGVEAEVGAAVEVAVDVAVEAAVDIANDIANDIALESDTDTDADADADADADVDAAVDAELLAIFIDEAADLLPQLGQALRAWHEVPADKSPASGVLRILHTLKGSARMAGAMDLGQRLHELEHAVNALVSVDVRAAKSIEPLLADLDGVMHDYFILTQPATRNAVPKGISGISNTSNTSNTSTQAPTSLHQTPTHAAPSDAPLTSLTSQASQSSAPTKAAPTKLVSPSLQLRVRADLLDRISSEAAELVVGSARIGSELQQQRHAMSELTANIARLRSQLRELDMQAETSIASQLAPAAVREFDPLEFDRFTRLQELSRMMAESMADVLSLQRSIARHADTAELAMAAQLRHARALQSDFKRVRVVAFNNAAERLHHLVRQLARDLGRQVRLEITGGELELDRGMLEKISAPLEHLLRNAVVHGIEAPGERLAAGKSEQGCVHITLSQQGNDVVLQLADDGRGLDLARIREQAIIAGLFASDAQPTEAELINCIFAPGLTTACEVTAVAGRGIGMDVVRATVLAQGGALKVGSQAGKGTCFTIMLPLTLATVQVVLARAGMRQIALQASQVQQVLQLAPDQANLARAAGAILWRAQSVRLYRLEAMLEPTAPVTPARQAMPGRFVILRQLDHLIALELDAVTGNREIVLKNLGAQLASVPGMAGATMLADASIVLIINPFALLAANPAGGADHAFGDALPSVPVATALPLAAMVMVVDDSLTMRRVSQRVLERHGYAATLARDGLDALEKLQAMAPPAAILLDIEMPRMDGFDLLRNLRQDPRLRTVPVIMITSRTATRHRDHAMQLGANAYLGKPYRENELLDVLTQFCAPANTETRAELEFKTEAEAEAETKAETKAEAEAKTEAEAEAEAEAQTQSASEISLDA